MMRVIEKHKIADNRRNFIISLTSIWSEHGIVSYAQQGMKKYKNDTKERSVLCSSIFFRQNSLDVVQKPSFYAPLHLDINLI